MLNQGKVYQQILEQLQHKHTDAQAKKSLVKVFHLMQAVTFRTTALDCTLMWNYWDLFPRYAELHTLILRKEYAHALHEVHKLICISQSMCMYSGAWYNIIDIISALECEDMFHWTKKKHRWNAWKRASMSRKWAILDKKSARVYYQSSLERIDRILQDVGGAEQQNLIGFFMHMIKNDIKFANPWDKINEELGRVFDFRFALLFELGRRRRELSCQ